MIPLWLCRPFFKAGTVVKKRRQRHHRGIGHHARRAARAVVSKPAIAGYVCIALWWPSPSYAPANGNYGGGGEFETAALFPPQFETPLAPEFFALPPYLPQQFEIIGRPTLLPELPLEQPTTPVPEPASALLLGTALAALAIVGRARA